MLVWMTNWTLCGAATRCVNKQCWKALIWKVPQQCHCYNRGWSQSCKALLAALRARGSHLQPETSEGWQKWFDCTGEWKSAHNVFLEYNGASASMLICQRHHPLLLAVSAFFPSLWETKCQASSRLELNNSIRQKDGVYTYPLFSMWFPFVSKEKILKNRQLLSVCVSNKRYSF